MSQKSSERPQSTLASEHFHAFLAWLTPQAESSGEAYENARRRLILFFASRKCAEPEALADETLDCAMRKVADIPPEAKPLAYLIGIAKNIYLDYLRRRKKEETLRDAVAELPTPAPTVTDTERRFACLEHCLAQLIGTDRQLVLAYYSQSKQPKIDLRKQLADQHGLNPNALRNRIFRLNQRLANCVTACLEKENFAA